MKKLITIAILITLAFSFTACNKYRVESNLTDERAQEYRDSIEIYEEVLKEDSLSELEKAETWKQMGIAWERLGYYDKAIEYYEKTLAVVPNDFSALNNMTAIYEEIGELEMALSYVSALYTYYPNESGVVNDIIKLFVAAGEMGTAQQIISAYAQYINSTKEGGPTQEDQAFLSEQFDYIYRVAQKNAEEEVESAE